MIEDRLMIIMKSHQHHTDDRWAPPSHYQSKWLTALSLLTRHHIIIQLLPTERISSRSMYKKLPIQIYFIPHVCLPERAWEGIGLWEISHHSKDQWDRHRMREGGDGMRGDLRLEVHRLSEFMQGFFSQKSRHPPPHTHGPDRSTSSSSSLWAIWANEGNEMKQKSFQKERKRERGSWEKQIYIVILGLTTKMVGCWGGAARVHHEWANLAHSRTESSKVHLPHNLWLCVSTCHWMAGLIMQCFKYLSLPPQVSLSLQIYQTDTLFLA